MVFEVTPPRSSAPTKFGRSEHDSAINWYDTEIKKVAYCVVPIDEFIGGAIPKKIRDVKAETRFPLGDGEKIGILATMFGPSRKRVGSTVAVVDYVRKGVFDGKLYFLVIGVVSGSGVRGGVTGMTSKGATHVAFDGGGATTDGGGLSVSSGGAKFLRNVNSFSLSTNRARSDLRPRQQGGRQLPMIGPK